MTKIFQTRALPGEVGIEVTGFDLREALDPDDRAKLQGLLDAHGLLVFPGQYISVDDHVRVLGTFGRVCDENGDGIMHTYVSNVRPDGLFGARGLPFHSDFSFMPHQPQLLSLYGTEIEGEPEPTMFANCVLACDRLPALLRSRLESMIAVHVNDYSADGVKAPMGRVRLLELPTNPPYGTHPRTSRPVIRIHPRTGAPLLGVSQFHTSHIEGMTSDESEAIIQDLFARLYSPGNLYAHHWQRGDLVIWDNIAIQHGRSAFEGAAKSARRTLCRVVISDKSVKELMGEVSYLSAGGFKL